jgi:iron complex outermembrane receptor protein
MSSEIQIRSGIRAPAIAAALLLVVFVPRTAPAQVDTAAKKDSITKLKGVTVIERVHVTPVPSMQRLTLPVTASVTQEHAERTINIVDPEDAVKYLPSIFLRKRNYGDTQATMATRVWGISSSARSLVFADGVPLTALIGNNNTIGGPRWGLVSPEEISRVDVMYGPFSAAYAGNSMGAVVEITTRQPDRIEGSLSQTNAMQAFSFYRTRKNLPTSQTNGTIGDRFGKLSFWLSGDYQDSHSQPLAYVTSSSFPSGTYGGIPETNKLGQAANVLGATGLLRTYMTNAKVKAAYDFTPWLRGAYTFGSWRNRASSVDESFLSRQSNGSATFAGQSGFASGYYNLIQQHFAHSLSLRTDNPRGDFDGEAIATLYRFAKDQQRLPATAASSDTTFSQAGRLAVLDGTNWSTIDLKGSWHRGGTGARHTVSFGLHEDGYVLRNPTYNTSEWRAGGSTTVASEGDGKTRSRALWAQDAWRITPALSLTYGGRLEQWRGYDGFNQNGTTTVTQPAVSASRFSPKGILAWTASRDWTVTGSVGKAYRFATAAELFQLVTTGTTFTSPNPDLKPDNVLAAELRVERRFSNASARVSLFQDDVHDAIISQFLPLVPGSSTLFSYVSNVDHVRARGIETVLGISDAFLPGLELSGSATYLDARTLALSGRASATAPAGSAVGKFLPNIPQWRATFQGTYPASDRLDLSLAGRYSGKLYTTLDNSDVHPNTYQGFAAWFVIDARAHYRIDSHWSWSAGIDNLLNRKYFLFHPFPQRTMVVNAKVNF